MENKNQNGDQVEGFALVVGILIESELIAEELIFVQNYGKYIIGAVNLLLMYPSWFSALKRHFQKYSLS